MSSPMEGTSRQKDDIQEAQRGRQEERTGRGVDDVIRRLRFTSPGGGESERIVKIDRAGKLKRGEGKSLLDQLNQRKSDNTPRPDGERLTSNQLSKALTRATTDQPYETRNRWKIEELYVYHPFQDPKTTSKIKQAEEDFLDGQIGGV